MRNRSLLAAAFVLLLTAAGSTGTDVPGCGQRLRCLYAGPSSTWPAPDLDAGVAFVEFAPPAPRPAHSVQDGRLAALGERLFFDRRLSGDGTLSCASCHDPGKGWGDGRPTSRGAGSRPLPRNSLPLFDVADAGPWGWTGARSTLWAQLLAPLFDPREMANPGPAEFLAGLADRPEYVIAFVGAFGAGARPSLAGIAAALQAYLRDRDEPTRFDAFLAGDRSALSDAALEGLHLFRTKARCANCHFGQRLSDGLFHNLRLSFFGEPAQDLGRYEVTGAAEDAGRFRTPSLRHVARTGPYMHNGLLSDLKGVIHFYDRGGGEVWARNAQEAAHPLYPHAARISPHIRPLRLSPGEKAALLAFLQTL